MRYTQLRSIENRERTKKPRLNTKNHASIKENSQTYGSAEIRRRTMSRRSNLIDDQHMLQRFRAPLCR
jgi:hypothetical protein